MQEMSFLLVLKVLDWLLIEWKKLNFTLESTSSKSNIFKLKLCHTANLFLFKYDDAAGAQSVYFDYDLLTKL